MYSQKLDPFIGLLQGYYSHGYNRIEPDDWRQMAAYLDEPLAHECPDIAQAVTRLATADAQEIREMRYSFNELFVGPEELKAAPYETVYVSPERVLMRGTTLSLRAAYREFGMEVDRKNVEADDHIAYECAFLRILLANQDQRSQEAFERFAREHLDAWVVPHVEAIRQNTQNAVCLGFADLLEAVYECILQTDERNHESALMAETD